MRAVVAMSGGVDSSVAAGLMVEAGYDVMGVMLKLWRGPDTNNNSGCCSLGAAEDARRVADVLGIPFYVLNFAEHFDATVRRNFHDEYLAGRTPNPCVRCNQWVKFGALMERADALDADVLVTGHYARVRASDGRYRLMRAVDSGKDQSYVLWMLRQRDLARCKFPVGEMPKDRTRAVAAELGLRTAHKPESQEICFVPGGDFGAYASRHFGASRRGPIVDAAGEVVGTHGGAARFTVGQRKGLGISLGVPVYVTDIDVRRNEVRVGPRSDLAVSAATLSEMSFTGSPPPPGARVLVQYRAHGDVCPARLDAFEEGPGRLRFEHPVESVAPGQSAALYNQQDPDELIGGGIISGTTRVAPPA